MDQVIEAIKFILNNAYVQFAGDIFQQIVGIIMGGNACPEIADLYLIWCEYSYMQKLCNSKIKNLKLAKELSNNSRYIDDISTLNLSVNFGSLSKEIYDSSLILEQSSENGHRDNFLDLHIYIKDKKFVTGIYHKVDDFDFEVINYPFPSSNITNSEGPKCFYSQLIRFARLCNTAINFCKRLYHTYTKLHQRGYDSRALVNRYNQFCSNTTDWLSYGLSQHELWKMSFKRNNNVVINVNNTIQLNSALKPCCIELTDITSNKAYDSKLNTHFKKMLLSWQSKTLKTQPQKSENTICTSSFGSIIVNENHGYKIVGLDNPDNFCYMNSIIQVLVNLLLHSGCTYNHLVTTQRFFPNALLNFKYKEGYKLSYKKRSLKILRSWFTKGPNKIPLLDGKQQQDVHEAFLKIMEILHDGTKQCIVPDLPLDLQDDSTFTSFPRFLFRFLVEKTIVCQKQNCKLTSISQEFLDEITLNIQNYSDVENMLNNSWSSNKNKTCLNCKTFSEHLETTKIINHPKVFRLVLLRFDNSLHKIDKSIKLNPNLNIFGINFKLTCTINHHGNSIRNGHYTSTVKYNSWWHINDNDVSPASTNFDYNNTAYLAFYIQ